MIPSSALLVLWVGFAVLAIAGIIAALVWAVRTRQFSSPDEAARLPLESGIPDEGAEEAPGPDAERPDRGAAVKR
jgi:nitrogen fixation-related uncharacterized protein